MGQRTEFEGEFYKGQQGGIFIDFPFNSLEIFGRTGVIRVKVWFDGLFYRLSLLPRSDGTHYFHIRKDIRSALGKSEGDSLKVVVESDNDLPELEIPDYLMWLLDDDPEMNAVFRKLSWSYKKQLIEYVKQPKTDDAKVHRINQFFLFLRNRKYKTGKANFLPDDEE
jgi:hypothetical protein